MATITKEIKVYVVDIIHDRLKEGIHAMPHRVNLRPSYELAADRLMTDFMCHMGSYDWKKVKATVVMGNHIKHDDPVEIHSSDDLLKMFRNPDKEIREIRVEHDDKDSVWTGNIYTEGLCMFGEDKKKAVSTTAAE